MTRVSLLVSVFALLGACGARQSVPCEPTVADVRQSESIADPQFPARYAETGGFRFGTPRSVHIARGGEHVYFLRGEAENPQGSLFVFDVATGEERTLVTADALLGANTAELSVEERALRERLRQSGTGITSYQLSKDGNLALIPISGKLFVLDLTNGESREIGAGLPYANGAVFSPDGRFVACVRDREVHVVNVASGDDRQLTQGANETLSHGLAEFVAQEEMGRYGGIWWSADSTHLAYQETDESNVDVLFASNPIDPATDPYAARYPRAGTTNAAVRLGVISVEGGDTEWIEWDSEAYPYLATVRARGEGFAIVVQDRLQQNEEIRATSGRAGATTLLHSEADEAWLNIDQSVPVFEGDSFLWSSERAGHFQLELRGGSPQEFELSDRGEAVVYEQLLHHTEEALFVRGSAEPSERHIFRIDRASGEASKLTSESGWHNAEFASGSDVWVHISDSPAGRAWRVMRGNQQVGELASLAADAPFAAAPTFLEVGERSLRAMIVKPRNFEPGRTYPVILSVYGGPGYVKVRRAFGAQLREQWIADHGYIVVSVDGRGTPGRGRAFERAIYRDVITAPMNDQIEGLRAIAAQVPEMDLDHVGIYGWSFGGYFSAMAVLRHPEVFHAGIAGAPVTDWRLYDTHYTERFMALPSSEGEGANEEGYDSTSALSIAETLERPLMLIHGTSDDNVYFAHTLALHDAFVRAARPHDLVLLAGSTHRVGDPQTAAALQQRMMHFFEQALRR